MVYETPCRLAFSETEAVDNRQQRSDSEERCTFFHLLRNDATMSTSHNTVDST